MILILKNDQGQVLAEWEIERDFGNIDHCIPASTMVSDIRSAYRRHKMTESEGVDDNECSF
jgi:hypothetical protein